MKGWVYIIGNRSMPGLWKIGYTERTAEERAEELDHTGIPHPYEVAYKIEIENAREIEQQTHRYLAPRREGREWFRCTLEEAVVAIKVTAGAGIISEVYVRLDRYKAEALHLLELRKREEAERAFEYRRQVEAWAREQERAIERKYDEQISISFNTHSASFRYYWVPSAMFLFLVLITVTKPGPALLFSTTFGALVGLLLKEHLEKKRSSLHSEIERQRKAELDAVQKKALVQLANSDQMPAQDNESLETQKAKTIKLLMKAGRGDAKAQAELGWQCIQGAMGDEGRAIGRICLEEAATQGYVKSQFLLGMVHFAGLHVAKDYRTAREWWEQAAQQSFSPACYFLGELYRMGLGVPIDNVRAYMWYTLAAKDGAGRSASSLEAISKRMTPGEIAQGRLLAQQFDCRKVDEEAELTA